MSLYVVYSNTIGKSFENNIDEKQYAVLIKSHEILRECKSVENIYNIVLMNYYEFEKELYQIVLSDEVFSGSYSIFNSYVAKMEQRLLNLLASMTLYLDFFKLENDVDKFSEHVKNEFNTIHTFIETQNQKSQEIRIVKFLRNHIQHNGLIVKNFSLHGKNLTNKLREQTLNLNIDKHNIKAKWYNYKNFSELDDMIDLKQFIRKYMDYISSVHETFRKVTKEKTIEARKCFEGLLQKYEEHKVVYIAENKDGQKINELAILLDWDNVRLDMIKKNHVPKAFSRHSINTKSREQEDD